jgi:hypothetical protein
VGHAGIIRHTRHSTGKILLLAAAIVGLVDWRAHDGWALHPLTKAAAPVGLGLPATTVWCSIACWSPFGLATRVGTSRLSTPGADRG